MKGVAHDYILRSWGPSGGLSEFGTLRGGAFFFHQGKFGKRGKFLGNKISKWPEIEWTNASECNLRNSGRSLWEDITLIAQEISPKTSLGKNEKRG
ncbi:hypothetical protein CDAR_188921 [Caerostris darwini]|uniref:Uncharacterized protein n=1 Tax=Caerostris darwini TaxID=1538125 RepID=A0AAV4VXR5_9ARAC|nr:hypothetical protein CDAR_188921 [Caerostris darwini]